MKSSAPTTRPQAPASGSRRGRSRPWIALLALALVAQGLLLTHSAPPAQAQDTPTTFISIMGRTGGGALSTATRATAQAFTTGSNAGGYALTSVDLDLRLSHLETVRDMLRVELWSATSAGAPDSRVAQLTIPAHPISVGAVSFAAPDGTTLSPETTYFVVFYTDGTGDATFQSTNQSGVDDGAATGWTTGDSYWYSSGADDPTANSHTWTETTTGPYGSFRAKFAVKGTAAGPSTLVSNVEASQHPDAEGGYDGPVGLQALAQVFTTGSSTGGYVLSSIELELVSNLTETVRDQLRMELWSVTSGGAPGSKSADLTVPAHPISAGAVTFGAPDGTSLAASTSYAVVMWTDGTGEARLLTTDRNGEDSGGAAGWSIADDNHAIFVANPNNPGAQEWAPGGYSNPVVMTVKGSAAEGAAVPSVSLSASPNPVAEGDSGTASVTVTATLSSALTSEVSIPVTVTRDSTQAADHDLVTSISISSGATEGTADIAVTGDTDVEAHETFTVALDTANLPAGVEAGSPASVTVTIEDDDVPAAPTNLRVWVRGPTYLQVAWDEPTGDLSGYDVHYTSADSSSVADGAAASGSDASAAWVAADPAHLDARGGVAHYHFRSSELTEDVEYRLRVRAVSAAGHSGWLHGTGTPTKEVPTNVCAKAGHPRNGRATISLRASRPNVHTYVSAYVQIKEPSDSWPNRKQGNDHPSDFAIHNYSAATQPCGGNVFIYGVPQEDAGATFDVRFHLVDIGSTAIEKSTDPISVTVWDVPAKPTSVGAAAGTGSGELDVAWTAPADTGFDGDDVNMDGDYEDAGELGPAEITDYRVRWRVKDTDSVTSGDQPGSWNSDAGVSAGAGDTEHTATGLTPSVEYEVQVRARNGVNPGSEWSDAASGTAGAGAVLSSNADLSALAVNTSTDNSDFSASLTLDQAFAAATTAYTATVANDVTHVKITPRVDATGKAAVKVGPSGGTLTVVADGSASASIALSVGDNAIDVEVTAENLSTKTYVVTITRRPAAPTGLTVTAGDQKLDVAWMAPAGTLSGYDVHYTSALATGSNPVADDATVQGGSNPSAADGWVDAAHTGTTAADELTGLTNGTPYRVRVRATAGAADAAGGWAHRSGTPVAPTVPTVSLSASPNPVTEGDSGTASVTVTATLSSALTSAVTIPVTVGGGTAGTGDRGTLTSITVNANQTTGTGTVTVTGDTDVEADETFTVSLGSLPSSVAAGSPSSVTVTIDDDDLPVAPTGLAANAGDAKLEPTWTAPAGTLEGYDVHYTAAASADLADDAEVGSDLATEWVAATHSGTNAAAEITGLANGDDYRVRVRAKSAAGAGPWATAQGTPAEPTLPAITLTSSDADSSVAESDSASDRAVTLTVTLPSAAPTGGATVALSLAATSTADADDYTLSATEVTIAQGDSEGTATLTIADDDVDEDDETLRLTASHKASTKSYSDGSLSITITDDDDAGVTVSESARTVEVGEETTYKVKLDSKPTADVTITATSSDTTKATVSPATLTFTPTNWSTDQEVTVTGVAVGTPDVTHAVTASTDAKYPTTMSIDKVDVTVNTSTKTFQITETLTANEGADADLTVTLGRAAPTGGIEFRVAYAYPTGSTATSADLGTTPSTVTVAQGDTTATLSVPISQDALVEGAEKFRVTITTSVSGWAASGTGKNVAEVTITDDEAADAKVAFGTSAGSTATHAPTAVAENNSDGTVKTVTVPVTISALPQSAVAFTVEVLAAGSATEWASSSSPGDFRIAQKTVRFATSASDTALSKNVTISLEADELVEFDETIELRIAAARPDTHMDYGLGDLYARDAVAGNSDTDGAGSLATITIDDDDADAAKVAFGTDAASTERYNGIIQEQLGSAPDNPEWQAVPVTISHLPDTSTTFEVEVTGGTAVECDAGPPEVEGHYCIATKSVTFGPGDTSNTKWMKIAAVDDDLFNTSLKTIELRLKPARASNDANFDLGDLYTRDAETSGDTDGTSSRAHVEIFDNEDGEAAIGTHHAPGSKHTKRVAEDVSVGQVTVPVTVRNLPDVAVTFTVEVLSAGTATQCAGTDPGDDPGDYCISDNTVTFTSATAKTQFVTVAIEDDEWVEHDQTVELELKQTTMVDLPYQLPTCAAQYDTCGNRATVTIADEDRGEARVVIGPSAASTVTAAHAPTGAEGDGTLNVPVTLSHLPEGSTTFAVEVLAAGTTARDSDDADNPTGNPKDYDLASTEVTFTSTGAKTQNLTISIADDAVEEDNETIGLRIAAARADGDANFDLGDYYERATATVNSDVVDLSAATVTLTSDDQVATVTLTVDAAALSTGQIPVFENSDVTVTVTADIPVGPGGWSVTAENTVLSGPPWGGMTGAVSQGCGDGQHPGFACANDYRLPAVFTILEGQRSATATLRVNADSRAEPDEERLALRATAARRGRSLNTATLQLRIRENAAGISTAPAALSLLPAETAVYTVALFSQPTADVTITPASSDTDYATVSGALTFTSQNWDTPQEVTVTGVAAGSATISHASASADTAYNQLASLSSVAVTVDAPVQNYAITSAAVAGEGQSAELTITLGALAPTGGLEFTVARNRTHDLRITGTPYTRPDETGRADIDADLSSPAATVTVAAGTRTATITEVFADDDLIEGDERYYLEISTSVSGWSAASDRHGRVSGQPSGTHSCSQDAACATVTITDPDSAGARIAFGSDPAASTAHTASAGEGAGTIDVAVTVSALPNEEIAFDIEVTGGTATEGTDYTIGTKQVTFAPTDATATQHVTITITDDALAEGAETVELRIAPADDPPDDLGDRYQRNQNSSTATVTIDDNDGAVDIAPTAVTAAVGASIDYTVVLRGARPTADVTVTPASSDTDKATVSCAGADPCALTFTSADWDQPQTVTVTGAAAGSAQIAHIVSGADAAYPASLAVASVDATVSDLPTVSLSASPNPVQAGSSVRVTATVSEALAADAVIPLTAAAGTAGAADYTTPGTITIAAGSTTGTTTVATTRDADTTDETFTVALGSLPSTVTAGTPAEIEITITAHPPAPRPPGPGPGPGPTGGGPGGGGGGGGGSGDDEDAGEVTRLWGADRYATSLAVARRVAELADGRLDTVVIAGGHSWADALVAGPLAGALDAAVLLSAPDGLDADTVAWLEEVGVSEIIAVGDTDRISDDALEALAGIDADIERITAEDPHAMSAAVARRIGRPASLGPLLGRTVIVASSRVFADALAAGPLAAAGPHPILLVGPDGLHADVAAYLADHADHVIVMGGTAAVTEAVEEQIRAIPQANRSGSRPMSITRLGGRDRYGTAVVFARWLTSSSALEGRVCFVNDTVGVATGLNAADAAASAPLLAETCTPLVLTEPDRMPPVTASYLRRAAELLVFGGTAAITEDAVDDWSG